MRLVIILSSILFLNSCSTGTSYKNWQNWQNYLEEMDIAYRTWSCPDTDPDCGSDQLPESYDGILMDPDCRPEKNDVYKCNLYRCKINDKDEMSDWYTKEEIGYSSECPHKKGWSDFDPEASKKKSEEYESISDRLKDPPGLRDLSDRDICIKHFTNKANNDWLNKTLTDAAIEKRNLDCSVYAAEENNILLKKELNKKIKCWAVDDYVRCYSY